MSFLGTALPSGKQETCFYFLSHVQHINLKYASSFNFMIMEHGAWSMAGSSFSGVINISTFNRIQFWAEMEKEERTIPRILKPPAETEFFLQWGSRKRLRCVRVRGNNPAEVSSSSRIRRRITSRFLTLSQKDACFSQPTFRYTRNSEAVTHRSESRKSSSGSLEKEERCYTTRGVEENGKITVERGAGDAVGDEENPHKHNNNNNNSKKKKGDVMSGVIKKMVWPKVCIGLSSKEKEEDFMAMKGCKLPQRPKKRAKLIQRTLLLVSPGAWLTDMSLERYEVREKKSCKKKLARGLKGMGSIESDSD